MPPRQVGPYVLEAPLGEGGMATVYRGRHTTLDLVRAVKVLVTRDPAAQERFAREAARLADFRHPNLVAIHETGSEPGGVAWFAMDLVEGETLAAHLARGPLPWAQAVDVVRQAARGVDALHAAGVVHRDLKPQNILVDQAGRAVVIDLGLALAPARDERLTVTGAVVGTVLYLAPEQVEGTVGPATDVHALGLILHEALTGRPAMEVGEGGALGALARIVDGERPRPGDAAPATPAALDLVVARATDLHVARRYPRAGALADALDAVRDRPGPSASALRLAKRAAAATVAVGALLLAAAVGARLGRRAEPVPAAADAPAGLATIAPGASRSRLAEGEREAQAVRRLPSGAARLAAAEGWLARWPEHPARTELRALRAGEDAGLVLAWLGHASDASEVVAVFVADDAVVTAGRDGTARRWAATARSRQPDGRQPWREVARRLLPSPALSLARTPDRRRVLVGCRDGSVHELLLAGGGLALRACGVVLERARVDSLALDPGGAFAVACSGVHSSASVMNLADGLCLPVGPADAPANDAAVTRAGRVVLAYGAAEGLSGHGLQAWELAPLAVRWRLPIRTRCSDVALSPDERQLAIGTSIGQVLIVPVDGLAGEDEVRRLTSAPGTEGLGAAVGNTIRDLVWSDDGRRLYAVSQAIDEGGGLRAWDTTTWREVRPPVALRAPVSLDVSPDGATLAIGTDAKRVELWRGE